ncbi:MAG: ABC transporter permease [Acidimicrobiia bacterium]
MSVVTGQVTLRHGVGYWLESYRSMLRFETKSLRSYLAVGLVVQILMGAGVALMYGYYLGELNPVQQTFIVTGIPVLAMIPVGFGMVPASIMDHKIKNTYDYVWSLPVPRSSSAAATFTVFTALAIPGAAVAIWLAALIYGIDLSVTWAIVPAVLLTSAVATSVGYALGHVIGEPRVTTSITNMVIFLVLLFSPIVVPIEQFPEWWASVQRVLPFWHMAVVIRDGLTDGLLASSVFASYVVIAGWTVGSWVAAGMVVARRR